MRTRTELTLAILRSARGTLERNIADLKLEEALSAAGGHRSVLGILKHIAAWTHVYHSYAFDEHPRHWEAIEWPRGMRDTIDPTQIYCDEIKTWLIAGIAKWEASLAAVSDEGLDRPHRCHWGAEAPLFEIVVMVTEHWTYHAGELNQILSIVRGQAWEYTEEVEENHISTAGHRVRPNWMSDEQVARYEAYVMTRDRELHGPSA